MRMIFIGLCTYMHCNTHVSRIQKMIDFEFFYGNLTKCYFKRCFKRFLS